MSREASDNPMGSGQTDETPCAMATVVKTVGSAYRRPGAQMLLYAGGRREGSISGGCLEADVAERALKAAATGQSVYVMYDTSGANGDVFFETGCNGAIGILIEPLINRNAARCRDWISERKARRQSGVAATVYRAAEAGGAALGSRFLRDAGGAVETDITDAALYAELLSETGTLFDTPRAINRTALLANEKIEVLLEKIVPATQLLICGAGQDAIPLAQCAVALGWRVLVADHREAFLTRERFPAPVSQILTRPEELPAQFIPDARTVAVIMTHHAGHDRDYLRLLLPSEAAYIGLLGPKRRGERLLDETISVGFCPKPEHLACLRSPAGLDIGAETPEEIAIALIAEMQAALTERPGGPLRDRQGPIHTPTESMPNAIEHASLEANREAISCPLSA